MPDPAGDPNTLRVLVVDDEPLARQRLLDLLEAEDDVEVVGTAESGRRAVEQIEAHGPDLVFLDVQMPGLTGLDVVDAVGPEAMPATVFVTAYDQHALAAFERAALDYLLKPFEDERFEQALGRARDAVRLRHVDALQSRLRSLLDPDAATPAPPPSPTDYLERIAVEM
ncbi:MAG: response regulator, partial [Rhodothermales bacterium]|nr:response regulator [Rhodothermales bacterium]